MSIMNRVMASVFSSVTYAALSITKWKRKTVDANLRHAGESCTFRLPDANELYPKMLRNLTRHVGEMLFHFGTYKNLPQDASAYPYNSDGYTFELAKGAPAVIERMRRGGIFLTAHYGNYEASGAWLCALGVPLMASFIPLRPAWLNRIVYKRIRCVKGRPYSIDAKTPRDFLKVLERGDLFCLLSDQDSRIKSALNGTFLGKPASLNPIPDFLLRHRPDTPVYFCWIEEPENSRKKILHAEIAATDKSGLLDGPYRKWLESRIQESPALWYGWTHRRYFSRNPELYR